jgi:hypothetical protein
MCFCVLLVGVKNFIQATKKGDAFLIHTILSLDVEPCPHEILPNAKHSRMCLRRMQTPYPNIDHMITPLILKKELNLHLDPSIICHKTNLQFFMNISTRMLKRGSFNIPNLQSVPLFSLSKRKMTIYDCVLIIMDEIDSPSRISLCP